MSFLLSLGVLTATALLSKVIKLVDLMITQGMGPSFIFWFVASVMPSFLIYTIPVSFLISVLVAFTRLSSDSEITAMKAGGLSLFSLMKPVITMAAVAFAATMLFTLYLFPWGNLTLKKLLFDSARSKIVSGVEEQTFYDRFKGIVLYVDHIRGREEKDNGMMEGIFISDTSGGPEPNVFLASQGNFIKSENESVLYLKLYNGSIHRRNVRNDSYHVARFSTYLLELSLPGGEPAAIMNKSNRELYPGELSGKIRAVQARGENAAPHIIDLHKRFALPASVFVFSLLALPLGIQKTRTARFTGFTIALGVVLTHYVLSTALEALGNNGVINPVLAVWGSDIAFGIIGLYLFYMAARDRPLLPLPWMNA